MAVHNVGQCTAHAVWSACCVVSKYDTMDGQHTMDGSMYMFAGPMEILERHVVYTVWQHIEEYLSSNSDAAATQIRCVQLQQQGDTNAYTCAIDHPIHPYCMSVPVIIWPVVSLATPCCSCTLQVPYCSTASP
jgi:hypothetical protein